MAKMFYKLEEAAERLGKSVDEVKELASTGKLQQYRDKDQLMFKREDVDQLAASGDSAANKRLDDSSVLKLSDTGSTDAIDLADESQGPDKGKKEDPRQATGVSVFDADEVEHADPMAQTQVTSQQSTDEELALESVGSGSGLLDLTRESDDTSLGAELLDEIYPGGSGGSGLMNATSAQAASAEASDGKMDAAGSTAGGTAGGSAAASSGVFDGALAAESGPSGLENMVGSEPEGYPAGSFAPVEPQDPAGAGLVAGALLGVAVALFTGFFVASASVLGVPSLVTATVAKALPMYAGGMILLTAVFAVAGFFIGKLTSR